MVARNPGIFHNANPPIHTHRSCEYCEKASRCIEQDDALKLSRCTGCNVTRYCSRECQVKDWKLRHKRSCKAWQAERDKAIASSGKPNAWTEFVHWLEFHHDTLANATLAYFVSLGSGSEMHNSPGHFVVKYFNDDKLPVERKFTFVQSALSRADFSSGSPLASLASKAALMDKAVDLRAKLSSMHTGAYLVEAHFGGKEKVTLPRIFQFSDAHLAAEAIPDLHDRISMNLTVTFILGERLRFCCGPVQELSTCCCGGWTHEEGFIERLERWAGNVQSLLSSIMALYIYFMTIVSERREDPSTQYVFPFPESDGTNEKKIEPKERSSSTPNSSTSEHEVDMGPSSTTADKESVSTINTVARSRIDDILSSMTRQAASAPTTSTPVTTDGVIDSESSPKADHSPTLIVSESRNMQLDIYHEPVLPSQTADLNAGPATDNGNADSSTPLTENEDTRHTGDTERSGALQSKKQKKKSKKGRRQVRLDSAGSAGSDRPSEPSASPSAVTSTTSEELPENTTVSDATETPETSTRAASDSGSESGHAIPESLTSLDTDTSDVRRDNNGSTFRIENDSMTAGGEGDTGQWVPVKSKKEKQQTKRNAQLVSETAVSNSIPSHDGRGDTHINEAPVVRPLPNHTLLEAEIDSAPRNSPIYLTPAVLSDTAPRSVAEPKPSPVSPTSSVAASPRLTPPRSGVELKSTHVPPMSSVAASSPGKRPWRRRTASSQRLSTAQPGARHGQSLKSSAPPGPQHPSSTLDGLHLDSGASPLTSNSASALDEARAITATREPPASLPANPTPTRILRRRPTSPETVMPPEVPQQSAYADKEARYTAARQRIFTEQAKPAAAEITQESIDLALAHAAIPSAMSTALESADYSSHSPSHGPGYSASLLEASIMKSGGHSTSLVHDAPPGLKHPGYTFGSLHFGGEVSQPALRGPSAGGAQSPMSASTIMESEQVLLKPEADHGDSPEQSYEDAQGPASDLQQQLPEPTWPSIQQSAAPDQSYEAEYSGIHQQYIPQQQQFYQPPNVYQQQQYQGVAYSPPGLVPPRAPWPYHTTYATQPSASPYAYSAPYGLYAGPYGTMPDPYAQSVYAQQSSAPVPADHDAAQTLKTAAEALKAAVRVLEGSSQDHSGVMERAYAVLDEAQNKYGDR